MSGDGQIEDHDGALSALKGVYFHHGQLGEAVRKVVPSLLYLSPSPPSLFLTSGHLEGTYRCAVYDGFPQDVLGLMSRKKSLVTSIVVSLHNLIGPLRSLLQ
ncbi:hypothetical protein PENFLA_c020G07138 [Penicillium flavigenum]|uniref:Uncharacterized protein n=1 Tax=Penicillium flavigenum TaxID=254877 RepID=A0A1V6SY14_9EURO|nr:hypothetical protein PENFLA_c020G07138 [Penicillium flavigenum]